jgi:hypothetical protein
VDHCADRPVPHRGISVVKEYLDHGNNVAPDRSACLDGPKLLLVFNVVFNVVAVDADTSAPPDSPHPADAATAPSHSSNAARNGRDRSSHGIRAPTRAVCGVNRLDTAPPRRGDKDRGRRRVAIPAGVIGAMNVAPAGKRELAEAARTSSAYSAGLDLRITCASGVDTFGHAGARLEPAQKSPLRCVVVPRSRALDRLTH